MLDIRAVVKTYHSFLGDIKRTNVLNVYLMFLFLIEIELYPNGIFTNSI